MTYVPRPIDTSAVELPQPLVGLVERLAKNTHEVWAAGRLAEGWIYGTTRNGALKSHPCLVPYEQLPESEKAYDRNTAVETLKVVMALGYSITLPH